MDQSKTKVDWTRPPHRCGGWIDRGNAFGWDFDRHDRIRQSFGDEGIYVWRSSCGAPGVAGSRAVIEFVLRRSSTGWSPRS